MSVYILRERSTKPIKPDDVVIPNTLPRLWYQSQTNISNLNTVSDVENFKKAFATISPTLPQDLRRYTEWLLVLREDRLKAEDAFQKKFGWFQTQGSTPRQIMLWYHGGWYLPEDQTKSVKGPQSNFLPTNDAIEVTETGLEIIPPPPPINPSFTGLVGALIGTNPTYGPEVLNDVAQTITQYVDPDPTDREKEYKGDQTLLDNVIEGFGYGGQGAVNFTEEAVEETLKVLTSKLPWWVWGIGGLIVYSQIKSLLK